MRPLAMMAMRSPSRSASSMKWVVSRMVRPAFSFCSRSQVDRRAEGSIPDVGSSSITTCMDQSSLGSAKLVHRLPMWPTGTNLRLGAQGDPHRQFSFHTTREFAGQDVSFILQLQSHQHPIGFSCHQTGRVTFIINTIQRNQISIQSQISWFQHRTHPSVGRRSRGAP